MTTLGVYLIVKNEEKVLERCIQSFSEIYDELIIVDTGSIDSTKDIAKKYTDKIYDFKWCDNFAAARTFAYSKVTSEWAMWCDADDVFVHSGREDLNAFLEECERDNIKVVNLIYNTCIDSNTGVVLETVIRERIHCKKFNHVWKGVVHETVFTEDNIDIEYPNAHLDHRPYSQRNYGIGYTNLLEKAIKTEKEYLRYLIQLGCEYVYLGKDEKARKMFLRAYNENKDISERAWAAYEITKHYYRKKEYTSAIEWALKCILIDPHFKYIYIILSEAAFGQEDYEMSINWAQMAINTSPSCAIVINDIPYNTYYPWNLISMAYFNMGNFVGAKMALVQCIANGGDIADCRTRMNEIDQYLTS